MHDIQMEYKYKPTESGSSRIGLLCSCSLFFSKDTTCIGSPYIVLLSSAWGDSIERNSCGFCCFCGLRLVGESCRFFWIELPLLVSVLVSAKRTGLELLIHIWCLLPPGPNNSSFLLPLVSGWLERRLSPY